MQNLLMLTTIVSSVATSLALIYQIYKDKKIIYKLRITVVETLDVPTGKKIDRVSIRNVGNQPITILEMGYVNSMKRNSLLRLPEIDSALKMPREIESGKMVVFSFPSIKLKGKNYFTVRDSEQKQYYQK